MISKFEWSSLSHLSFYPQMTLRKDFALMHMINTPSPIVRTSGGLWTLQSNPHFHTLSKYRVGYLSFRISFLIWSLRQLVDLVTNRGFDHIIEEQNGAMFEKILDLGLYPLRRKILNTSNICMLLVYVREKDKFYVKNFNC